VDDDATRFVALGIFDPDAPLAETRLQMLRLLVERGVTEDELVVWQDALPELASRLALRPGGGVTSLAALSDAMGMALTDVQRLWRSLGFPDRDPDADVVPRSLEATFRLLSAGTELLGDATIHRLARVLGISLAQIADAVVSAGIVQVVVPTAAGDDAGLALLEANFALGDLIEPFTVATALLLRMHLEQAIRPAAELDGAPTRRHEQRTLAVGFADLSGSTRLAGALSFDELGDAIADFEDIVADTVAARGGRLVKLIGDEAMFTAPDAATGCRIALDIVDRVATRPNLPAVRAGVCFGAVLVRSGDCFGPVVNRASRLVGIAEPGEVLVDRDLANAGAPDRTLRFRTRGQQQLRGIDEPVAAFSVTPA
jgi:adenylate cyclase